VANTVGLKTRKTVIRSFVWSIAIYGSETWTILKAEGKSIKAFETWSWGGEQKKKKNEQKTIWKTTRERRKK